jgi:hypothetical protein
MFSEITITSPVVLLVIVWRGAAHCRSRSHTVVFGSLWYCISTVLESYCYQENEYELLL